LREGFWSKSAYC